MRDPLLLPAVLMMGGILVGRELEFGLGESAWPLGAFGVLWMVAPRKTRVRGIAGGLAILFAGVLIHAAHRPGPPPEIDAGVREVLLVEGCVVEPTVLSPDRARFTLELEPGARARVSLPLEEVGPVQRLSYGQKVEIEARLRKPHNYQNPGGFDYAGYLARRDIYWTGFMPRDAAVKVLEGRCGWRALGWVFALRTALLDRLERLYAGDEYATGLMQAILAGETSRVERTWTEDFRRTGSYHALVISGVHITVLAGVLLFCLRLLPVSDTASLCVTAVVAWVYAVLAGLTPPVVRAAGGFSLYLVARFCFRRTRVVNILAAVAIVFLAWDPEQLLDASFQLSFLAVAALGILGVPWIEATSGPVAQGMRQMGNLSIDPHLEPRVAQWRVELRLVAETLWLWTRIPMRWAAQVLAWGMRLLLYLYDLFVVSVVVQAGLALPMIWYFHRVSFTGVSANLAIVPAMNALVPAGFLAAATGWNWVAAVARGLLWISTQVAEWHAAIEPARRVADPPAWLAVAFGGALVLVAIAGRRLIRRVFVVLSVALFGLLVWQPWPQPVVTGVLELTAIDVGQGDSLLVVFPGGATMLVDGGGVLTYGQTRRVDFDTGEDIVSPYLWSRGIRRLDTIVATHAHQDHVGGLAALIANFRPKELWTGANPPAELLDHARRLGVGIARPRQGVSLEYSGARVEVLAPGVEYGAGKAGNNDSLAIRIEYGSRSFLLTGDLERPVENRLLAEGLARHADVLKVGHHGSKTSTTGGFLEAVSPSIALISAGYENSFGHPHPEVIQRLRERGVAILRTDLGGLATVKTDGSGLWFEMQQWRRVNGPRKLPIGEGLLQ